MTKLPEGYERATGVKEVARRCLNPKCQKLFRTPNDARDISCPYCGHTDTAPPSDG